MRREAKGERSFFSKIKQEVKVVCNLNFILEKLDREGFLNALREAFDRILSNEINFALGELLRMSRRDRHIELKSQLVNNTYIFKENLKLISSFAGWLSSRAVVEGEDAPGGGRRGAGGGPAAAARGAH